MIIYIYDLFGKNVKEYNKIKRRFYYDLKKILLGSTDVNWKTKSMLVAPEYMEKNLDLFFKKYTQHIIVYKFKTETIAQLI